MIKNVFKSLAILFLTAILFIITLSSGIEVNASSEEEEIYVPGEVIVTLTNEQSLKFENYTEENFSEIGCIKITDLSVGSTARIKQQMRRIMMTNNLWIDPKNYHHQYKLSLSNNIDVLEAIELLQQRIDILSASPNYFIDIEEEPTQTTNNVCALYSNITVDMWVNDYLADTQWGLDQINICDAWDIEIGSYDVKVGIIDSGIIRHSDLESRLDLGLCKSFTKYDPCIDQPIHGTSVAGIIGAESNNEIGITGVCHCVSLVSLKVTDEKTGGRTEYILSAIDYAIEKNIQILNISMGAELTNLRKKIEYEAKIKEYPGLVVCAAGNDGLELELDGLAIYPASFNLDNLITVGASDVANNKADFSNYGNKYVDIFAPGVNIMTTYTNGSLCQMRQGTSFAAPFVSGVAALLLSYNPNFTAKDLKDIICAPNLDQNGNMVSSSVKNFCISGKILDAAAALNIAINWR